MINWISLVFFFFFLIMYTWAPTIWFLFWNIFRQIGQFGGKPCPEFFSQCWIQLGDPKGFWFFDPTTFCTRCLFKTKLIVPKFSDFVASFFLLRQVPITNFHSIIEVWSRIRRIFFWNNPCHNGNVQFILTVPFFKYVRCKTRLTLVKTRDLVRWLVAILLQKTI